MNSRDLELLSAYLDGQLDPSDSTRLESRLASDESLRTALDNLRSTRGLLRQLPSRRAPRTFTLTPQMAGIKPPTPRIVPVFRFATALATFLFVITFVINGLITLSTATLASAPAPAAFNAAAPMSAQEAAPAPTSAPAAQAPALPLAAIAPTETLTPKMAVKSDAPQVENNHAVNSQNESSVPFDFEILFGILAVGFGITAWILPRNNESNFRKNGTRKRIKHKGTKYTKEKIEELCALSVFRV